MSELTITRQEGMLPLDQNPAAVFVGAKAVGSQRTYKAALNDIALMLGASKMESESGADVTMLFCDWSQL